MNIDNLFCHERVAPKIRNVASGIPTKLYILALLAATVSLTGCGDPKWVTSCVNEMFHRYDIKDPAASCKELSRGKRPLKSGSGHFVSIYFDCTMPSGEVKWTTCGGDLKPNGHFAMIR